MRHISGANHTGILCVHVIRTLHVTKPGADQPVFLVQRQYVLLWFDIYFLDNRSANYRRFQRVPYFPGETGISSGAQETSGRAVASVFALFCHFPKSTFSHCAFCIYIICNQHEHSLPPHFHRKTGYPSKSPRKYLASSIA